MSPWRPTFTTFWGDFFGRHGHPLFQLTFVQISRDSAYLQEGGVVCVALQSYSWLVSILDHSLWPLKNTTTSSRQKKWARSTSRYPAPKALSLVSIGREPACILSTIRKRHNLPP